LRDRAFVISPAGNITQTARGWSRWATSSLRSAPPVTRSPTSALMAAGFWSNTTHWWPWRAKRQTILPPILPSPIMNADPHSSSPKSVSSKRLPDGVLERRQARRDVRAEMDAQHTPIAVGQDIEIAARLRGLDDAEGVSLARHLEIGGGVAGDLQEHPGIGAAFVRLSGQMKEPRPKAEAGGDTLAIADQDADILQRVAMAGVAFDIGEERAVVVLVYPPEVRRLPEPRPG
jgi:hypothetical protein